MSKLRIKQILTVITVIAMLCIFNNMFAQNNNSELKDAVKNGAFLVDVRTPAEFSNGTAKGAVNIPLDELPSELEKFKDKKSIVVFCRSGNRSGKAKKILEKNGFENVFNGGTWKNVDKIVNE